MATMVVSILRSITGFFFTITYPEVLIAAAAAAFFIGRLSRRRQRPSTAMANYPVVGMLPSVFLNLHRVHDRLTGALEEATGSTFVFRGPWLAGMDFVVTADPANVKYVTSTNFGNFVKGSHLREILDVLGDGISVSDFDDWVVKRKLGHGLLHQPRFLRFMRKSTRDKLRSGLLPLLAHFAAAPGGGAVDLQEVLQRFNFDITCRMVFGVDLGSLSPDFPAVPLAKAIDDGEDVILFRHMVPRSWWRLLRRLRMGPEKKMAEALVVIDDFVKRHILSRKQELLAADGEDEPADLLTSYIINSNQTAGGEEAQKFLRDSTVDLMAAGRETTSAALTWFFWLIATNPSVEAKILEELTSVASTDGPSERRQQPVVFDAEELDGCVYLHAALREALRLFPPIPVTHKSALSHDVLPTGEKVGPGTIILFSMYAMGRMERIWGKDRLEFKPDRWISEKGGGLREESSYKYMVFGAGPRFCVGKHIASAQMKVVAAAVIYNFRVRLVEGHPVCSRNSCILHMNNGLMVTVEERGR